MATAISPRLQAFIDAYHKMEAMHVEFYDLVSTTREAAQTGGLTDTELVDVGYVMRESEKLFEDLRKESKKTRELLGKLACVVMTTAAMRDPTNPPKNIQGVLATGTPKVKQESTVPSIGTPEYKMFLASLGVPEESIEAGILKPHWPAVADQVTELAQKGKKIPPGLGKQFPRFSTTYLRKRGSTVGFKIPVGGNDEPQSTIDDVDHGEPDSDHSDESL